MIKRAKRFFTRLRWRFTGKMDEDGIIQFFTDHFHSQGKDVEVVTSSNTILILPEEKGLTYEAYVNQLRHQRALAALRAHSPMLSDRAQLEECGVDTAAV